jgi:hypothetical protein
MALPANASEYNLQMSLKKYFKDNLTVKVKLGETVVYSERALSKWVSVVLGSQIVNTITNANVLIYICTRRDNEGLELSKLRDSVLALLNTKGGTRHIPFYDVNEAKTVFTPIGALALLGDIIISDELTTMDKTRYKVFTITLKWVSNV